MRRFLLITGVFFSFLLALLAVSAGTLAYRYHTSYYPGVVFAGSSLSGSDKATASNTVEALKRADLAHTVVIEIPDRTQTQLPNGDYPMISVSTTAAELGLQLDSTNELSAAWAVGHDKNPISWIRNVVPALFTTRSFGFSSHLDSTALKGFVGTKVSEKIVQPAPARLDVTDTTVSVTPPRPGLAIDQEDLIAQLKVQLSNIQDEQTTHILAKSSSVDAVVTEAMVQPYADTLNAIGDAKLSFTATGVSTLSPTRAQILQWFQLTQDDQGKLALTPSSAQISTYLATAKGLDTTKSLTAATTALQSLVSSSDPIPKYKQIALTALPIADTPVTAGSYTLGLFPGKYVEVNLAEQKMYRIDGDNLEKVYRVSTGKWSTPTPKGTFNIASKTPRAYSAEFGLYMPWWENFVGTPSDGSDAIPVGAYGLHELPEWPNGYKEGEGHLGTPVSHGCVRLGVGDAEEVYNWTDIGTPVVIH